MNQDERKEYLFKEIDLIQDIIKRMASNSFLIKGWALTLVVITMLIKGKDDMVIISIIPLIAFWFLDAYFLQQERMYRNLYEWVIGNRLKNDENLFNMNATKDYVKKPQSKLRIMFSQTLGLFYIPIGVIVILYFIAISFGRCCFG